MFNFATEFPFRYPVRTIQPTTADGRGVSPYLYEFHEAKLISHDPNDVMNVG